MSEMKEIVNQRAKYNDTDDMLEDKKQQEFLRSHPILRVNKRFNDSDSLEKESFTQKKKKKTDENIDPNAMENYDLNFQVEEMFNNSQDYEIPNENASDPLAQPSSFNNSQKNYSEDMTDCSQSPKRNTGIPNTVFKKTFCFGDDKATQTDTVEGIDGISQFPDVQLHARLLNIENAILSLSESSNSKLATLGQYYKCLETKLIKILSEIKVDVREKQTFNQNLATIRHQNEAFSFDASLIPLTSMNQFRSFEESLVDKSLSKSFVSIHFVHNFNFKIKIL